MMDSLDAMAGFSEVQDGLFPPPTAPDKPIPHSTQAVPDLTVDMFTTTPPQSSADFTLFGLDAPPFPAAQSAAPAAATLPEPPTRPTSLSPHDSGSDRSSGELKRKRERNTEAARRYRQRKVDQVAELEEALAAMTRERDELKLKLARSETEVDVLRGMAKERR
nr:hypothetical protein CFP56_11463 [Quercus suber]